MTNKLLFYWSFSSLSFLSITKKSSTIFTADLHLKLRNKLCNKSTVSNITLFSTQYSPYVSDQDQHCDFTCFMILELPPSFTPCSFMDHFTLPKVHSLEHFSNTLVQPFPPSWVCMLCRKLLLTRKKTKTINCPTWHLVQNITLFRSLP